MEREEKELEEEEENQDEEEDQKDDEEGKGEEEKDMDEEGINHGSCLVYAHVNANHIGQYTYAV